MHFPEYRARRLRQSAPLRRMVRETVLQTSDLIYPLFACEGEGVASPISSMPGCFQFSIDRLEEEAQAVYALGIPAIILFGIPDKKDALGTGGYAEDGIVQRAIRALKQAAPELMVISDVCLCEYTSHGHCGVLEHGYVQNDPTLELLAQVALSHAHAGADMVAPSDMMDGRVGAIRRALDDACLERVPLMSYAVKYASAFYGPFREAAESAPTTGDRRAYQMDPANVREAFREAALDVGEGADILMVKPALSYLDVISAVRSEFPYPIAAYNVSGEYSMVKAAAAQGWIDERLVAMEILTSIKRAGADLILTYHAKDAAKWLKEG